MDAIRNRRNFLKKVEDRANENAAIMKKRKFREETMRCNIIAQRMELQEHLSQRADEIIKVIDEFVANEDDSKERLSKDFALSELFGDWMSGYKIYKPTDYFLSESKEDDIELEYNT
jgi:hypothetical protein